MTRFISLLTLVFLASTACSTRQEEILNDCRDCPTPGGNNGFYNSCDCSTKLTDTLESEVGDCIPPDKRTVIHESIETFCKHERYTCQQEYESLTENLKKNCSEAIQVGATTTNSGQSELGKIYNPSEGNIVLTVAKWVVLGIVCFGLAAFFILIIFLVFKEGWGLEALLRVFALLCGLLIYFGGHVLQISFPQMIFKAMVQAGSMIFGMASVFAFVPAGAVIAWYMMKMMRKDTDRAHRIAILVGTLITSLFADLLAQAFTVGLTLATLAPNLTFMLGVGLYIVFKYERKEY